MKSKQERTERLDLRLTPDEMKILDDLVKKSGLTKTDVVRQLIRFANVSSVIR